MAAARLFAYGTLMRGFPLHPLLDGRAPYLGPGRITARLLDLGAYPAIVPDRLGVVLGEVYEVDEALWRALDSAEGPQYHRHEVAVRMAGGQEVTAFAYWYGGPIDRAVPIPNGDYRSHAPARSIHRHPGA